MKEVDENEAKYGSKNCAFEEGGGSIVQNKKKPTRIQKTARKNYFSDEKRKEFDTK